MVPSLNSPMVLLVLLALCSTQPAKAFAADGGMTMLEVEMAEKGSFSYASLPEDKMEILFKKYLLTYSREVKHCQICQCPSVALQYSTEVTPRTSFHPSMRQLRSGRSDTSSLKKPWLKSTLLTVLKKRTTARQYSASLKPPISLQRSFTINTSVPCYPLDMRDS